MISGRKARQGSGGGCARGRGGVLVLSCRIMMWAALASTVSAFGQSVVVEPTTPLARGDAAWARRTEGSRGGLAAPGPIGEAVTAYEQALRAAPESLEAHWKLMRALWFQGDYATASGADAKSGVATDQAAIDAGRKEVFGRGREVGDSAFAQLSRQLGRELEGLPPAEVAAALRAVPEAVPIYFWAAVNWGLWGEAYGKMAAARQGVAGRIRDYTEVVIALDPHYEQAGGHRVLGRLHARAPRVPFVTGWIDRNFAIAMLRRAVVLAPSSTFNRLYLAEALLEHGPAGPATTAEVRRLLDEVVVNSASSPDGEVERTRNVEVARSLLASSRD